MVLLQKEIPTGRVDCRSQGEKEILCALRDIFQEYAERELSFEMLVGTGAVARRVMSFCAISQVTTEIRKDGAHYLVALSGSPCRCG